MGLTNRQEQLAKKITNKSLFALHASRSVPMGWLAGMSVESFSEESCTTSVPFRWWNKNPFKSIYFAVQSMAAELSTATSCLIAVEGHQPSVAFIIVDLKASFPKKATGKVYFTCEDVQNGFRAVEKCIETGEAANATFKTVGKMKDGTVVSEFKFTWSFKQRRS